VKKQIAKLEGPCLQCAELVFEELQQVALLSEVPEFKRFPKLRVGVLGVVNGILRRHLEPATQMLRDLIQIELAYINTNHPDFVGMGGAMRTAKANPRPPEGVSTPSPPPPLAPVQPPPAPESQESTTGGFFSNFFAPRNQRRPRGTTDSQGTLDGFNPPRPIFQSANTLPLNLLTTSAPSRGSLTGGIKLPSVPSIITPTAATMSSRERVEVDIIKSLLINYMVLVKKNVADSVPKTIVHFMVNSAKDVLQRELVVVLYKEDLFESLFSEESGLPGRREKCRAEKKALDRVIEVMGIARDGIE
jgi:dynamin 1-like protein